MKLSVLIAIQFITLIVFLNQFQQTESFAIFSALMSVTSFGSKWILQAFTGFLGFHGSEQLFSLMKGARDQFADLQKEMQQGFDKLNDQITTSSETIVNKLSHQIQANAEFNRVFHKIEDYILRIKTQFNNLQDYLRKEEGYQNETLYNHAVYLTSSSDDSVISAMYTLDNYVNDQTISYQLSKGVILTIINYLNALQDVKHCDAITAPSEVLYVFLHYLSMIQLRGMVTVQEGYNLLNRVTKNISNYYQNELDRIENATVYHIQHLMQHMDKLKSLSSYSYACMARNYKEHQNYERFIQFLPLYLASEMGLEHYYKVRAEAYLMSCSQDCPWYDIATFNPNPHTKVRLNYLNRCWGMVRNCDNAEISGRICMHNMSDPTSIQMYSKFENENSCKLQADTSQSIFNWYKCTTCQCVCDTKYGQNYVYIAPMMAPEGKVVTGVRFEKKNQTIYLNIEYSNALPFAFADNDAKWNEIPEEIPRLNRDKFFQMYHFCRHFTLSDVTVAKDQVVVGVQLYPVAGERCTINLRVFGRQINILNGNFTPTPIVTHWNQIPKNTKVIDTENLIGGVDAKPQNVTTGQDEVKLVKFSHSPLTDNFGQNSVPYFDTQQVTSRPKMVQAGVGLYYRTTEKYAGYLAPRLIAFNSMEYLTAIEKKPEVIKDQLDFDRKASRKSIR